MILIVDDDSAVQASLALLFRNEGFETEAALSPRDALEKLGVSLPALVLLDLNFSMNISGSEGMDLLEILREQHPELPVILITGWASIDLAVRGMKLGARDFISKPWQNQHLLQTVKTILSLSAKTSEFSVSNGRKELDLKYRFRHIVGQDTKLLQVLDIIGRVAATDASVLITGESGTGKELIAEAIHQNSKRKNKPFVKVNLGGISTTLFESELFGHIRGAFTDARVDRAGRFEMADKGTIFLDEIGELDLASQVKLLRVLQERSFEPLGSSKSRFVDVRVICATNKNLDEMVKQGLFREDLLYRINLISVHIPPLRERPDDIPLLADFFVRNLKSIYQRPDLRLSTSAKNWLAAQPLAGNIRELKNLVERTVLLNPGDTMEASDFQRNHSPGGTTNEASGGLLNVTLEEMELMMIKRAMDLHQNRISRVARSLGITRFALYRRLDKYGIVYNPEGE